MARTNSEQIDFRLTRMGPTYRMKKKKANKLVICSALPVFRKLSAVYSAKKAVWGIQGLACVSQHMYFPTKLTHNVKAYLRTVPSFDHVIFFLFQISIRKTKPHHKRSYRAVYFWRKVSWGLKYISINADETPHNRSRNFIPDTQIGT